MSKPLPRHVTFTEQSTATENRSNLEGIPVAAPFTNNTTDVPSVDQSFDGQSTAAQAAPGNAYPDTTKISTSIDNSHPSSGADFAATPDQSLPMTNLDPGQYSVAVDSDAFGGNNGPSHSGFTNLGQSPSVDSNNHSNFNNSDGGAALIFSESGHGPGANGGTTSTSGASATVTSSAATGLVINVSYDASVNNAPAGFTAIVDQVVQYFESHYTDPITININVGYGEVGGTSLGFGALGESETYLTSVTYSGLNTALTNDAKDSADSSAVASLPASNPNGGNFWISTAEAKALGLMGASSSVDGYVGFSSSNGIFDYNNTDGVSTGTYDFYGVVAHEISEVMGRILLTGATIGTTSNSYDALDLFHYSSPGVHDFSGSIAGYFSIDGGQTSLNTFNTKTGGDSGDWAGATTDAYNAFANSGVVLPISSGDLTALDAIGWDAASSSPPPSLPDLTVSNMVVVGTNIDFNINNIGTVSAGATSTTGVYLSTDSTITTSDTLIGTISTPDLAAGSFVIEGVPLSAIPAQTTAGTYYFGVIADSTNSVTENNENNNSAAIPLILGTNGADTLNGTSASNIMLGFGGNDTIYGGGGSDVLVGGAGNDHFAYKATADGGGAGDLIVDFMPGSDVLDFSASAFGRHLASGGANTGTLDPSHFVSGSTEGTFSGRGVGFWFDTANHTLYLDSNGNSAGGQIAMAQLENGVTISNTSIHLV